MRPEFLEVEDVLQIHADQLERYGGLSGLRDHGLLLSAVAMPRSTYGGEFLHGDLLAMAAAYLFHITRNHPFVDGNKRTGAAAALVFLALHGIEVTATDDALYELVMAVAKGDAGKEAVEQFLRANSRPE